MPIKKKYPKIVISGYIGFDNFGDEAIFDVLCQNLKKNNAQITAISSNPQKTASLHKIKTCKTFNILSIIFAIANSDALISGGGSILQDKTSLKSLIYYLFIILLAKVFNKKIIIFAQGIGPITNRIGRLLTKFILKFAHQITVRDEKSLFLLRGWGICAKLQPDPAFNLELPPYSPQNRVGIQLRAWKYLNEPFLKVLSDEIIQNFSDKEILIFSFQDSQDFEICKDFQTRLLIKNPMIKTKIIKNDSPLNIQENMKTLEYLIAMRFHACLLAIKFGIKTLAINYDEKVEKLSLDAQIPYINLDKPKELNYKISTLKALKTSTIFEYATTKKFDFTEMNELLFGDNC